ncbi:MAG: PIG-L family deacetylase [Actinomycetota bacterium]|nr:PIG-L family deacetylase [Actinomycetota bacterium]
MRLLGIFAHPDDETFCIGGTLAKYIAGGAEAMVVSFTRGEAGQIRDAAVATRRTLGEKRAHELELACQALGVQHVRCLDYGDGKLKHIPQTELVGRAVGLIREFRPHVVFTFDESGAYGHPDHIAICHATTTACQLAGDPDHFPEQLQTGLVPHTPDRLYHSYFPRNDRQLLRLLVSWLQGLDTKFRGSDDFIHALMLFADESTMLGYASDHLDVQWYPMGFYIIEQGEPATSLYLILSGSVDIFVEDATDQPRYIVTLGPGSFVGETGLAYGKPRNAHVVARENTTCLVFSPGEPPNFAGRGEDGQFAVVENSSGARISNAATTRIDVGAFVQRKVEALSQHRTQYSLRPDMFPLPMLEELLGAEHFVQVLPAKAMSTELLPGETAPASTLEA